MSSIQMDDSLFMLMAWACTAPPRIDIRRLKTLSSMPSVEDTCQRFQRVHRAVKDEYQNPPMMASGSETQNAYEAVDGATTSAVHEAIGEANKGAQKSNEDATSAQGLSEENRFHRMSDGGEEGQSWKITDDYEGLVDPEDDDDGLGQGGASDQWNMMAGVDEASGQEDCDGWEANIGQNETGVQQLIDDILRDFIPKEPDESYNDAGQGSEKDILGSDERVTQPADEGGMLKDEMISEDMSSAEAPKGHMAKQRKERVVAANASKEMFHMGGGQEESPMIDPRITGHWGLASGAMHHDDEDHISPANAGFVAVASKSGPTKQAKSKVMHPSGKAHSATLQPASEAFKKAEIKPKPKAKETKEDIRIIYEPVVVPSKGKGKGQGHGTAGGSNPFNRPSPFSLDSDNETTDDMKQVRKKAVKTPSATPKTAARKNNTTGAGAQLVMGDAPVTNLAMEPAMTPSAAAHKRKRSVTLNEDGTVKGGNAFRRGSRAWVLANPVAAVAYEEERKAHKALKAAAKAATLLVQSSEDDAKVSSIKKSGGTKSKAVKRIPYNAAALESAAEDEQEEEEAIET